MSEYIDLDNMDVEDVLIDLFKNNYQVKDLFKRVKKEEVQKYFDQKIKYHSQNHTQKSYERLYER